MKYLTQKEFKRLAELTKPRDKDGNIVRGLDSEYHDQWMEKFAEIIVKECASLCDINSTTYKYSFTPARALIAKKASKHCEQIILRHFGVDQ
jgi:hypothetical protein